MVSTQIAAASVPTRFTLLVCQTPDSPYPDDTVTRAFPEDEYVVLSVSPEKAVDALSRHRPDAILASNAPAVAKLFRSIEQTPEQAPMRVLLPAPDSPPSETSPADAVLTQDSASWGTQLLPLLRMRAQIMALREENRRLRETSGKTQSVSSDIDLELFKRYIFNNVGHELRTPLLQMKAALANLAQDPTNSTLIDLASKATARLEGNVQNLLQIAQSTNISLDAAYLGEAIDVAMRSLRNSWRNSTKVHRIALDIEPNLPAVLADKRAIGSVITHLIENALKFSEDNVVVRAARRGEYVAVSVEDQGIGIAPEQHETIFGEFVQGDLSSTRRFDGMGIGLTIVRVILDRHHTSVSVESEPGRGARFVFMLRVVPLDGAHP
jgi:signal transduction histidine kinase